MQWAAGVVVFDFVEVVFGFVSFSFPYSILGVVSWCGLGEDDAGL